jgi:UDP-N-acetylmuramate dehydrogenase
MRHDYRMSDIDMAGGGTPALRGHFLYNEPMGKHVSWRAGGAAQRVYIPADLDDLTWLVRSLPAHEEIHMLGLGSNMLVRDGGVAGVVILLHGVLKKLAIESRTQGMPPAPTGRDTALIYAQAGVASPKLARFAANNNLVGGEFWAGIPGTIGGAIAMNAGCYGGETWDKLVQVLTLNRQGQLNERLPGEYVTGYRHVALKQAPLPNPDGTTNHSTKPASGQVAGYPPHAGEGTNVGLRPPTPINEWFVGGWFRLEHGDGAASREIIKTLLKKRIAAQPLGQPNAGSVFRNPPGDHAARLIESCGLKGFRIGDAQVSEKHANFIVNLGHAYASDIERLIEHVEDCVEAHTNVRLIREVRIIGERQ